MSQKTLDDDWMREGWSYLKQENYEQALFAYQQAEKLHPSDGIPCGMKGVTLNFLGHHQEAYQALSSSLRRASTVPAPLLALVYAHAGWALNKLYRYQEAYDAFIASFRFEPNAEAWVYAEMGGALNNLGRFQEGYNAVAHAVALNPDAPATVHIDASWALLGLGRFQEALVASECAIKADPTRDMAFNNRGAALNHLGRYREALFCFKRAIHLNSDSALYYRNIGIALQGLGNMRGAVAMYDRALTLDPQDGETLLLRQEIYSKHRFKLFLDHFYGSKNQEAWESATDMELLFDDKDQHFLEW